VKALPAQIQKVATVRNAKCPVIFTNNTVKDPLCFLSIFPEKKKSKSNYQKSEAKKFLLRQKLPPVGF